MNFVRGKPEEFDAVSAIVEADVMIDPLDGLIARSAEDVGAAFEPETIDALVELRRKNRSAFETLRARLKKIGVRVTELDKVLSDVDDLPKQKEPSSSDILAELANGASLFHGKDGQGYADIELNGHRETWQVRSKGFRQWLTREYYEAIGGAASSEAVNSALNLIEARSHIEGPERDVAVRVAAHEGRVYLDLCDDDWSVVEIDVAGWRLVSEPPVRFRRTSGMRPLPTPQHGGSIESLRKFVNLKTEQDFVLAVAWALAALNPKGPYPVLAVAGEQGSAKSTFCSLIRSILDPCKSPLRSPPSDEHVLFITASNAHILAFDNVSGLREWFSDTLCRVATGGGFAARQLYTDQEEVIFEVKRPVILNGIDDFVTRPDLADRSVFLSLEAIPEDERRAESELWAEFESEKGAILGALLDGVSEGLRRISNVTLPGLPRMADFARWASACETAFWEEGTFYAAYGENREESIARVIEGDPVATAVWNLAEQRTMWTGNSTALLKELNGYIDNNSDKPADWPKSANVLSNRIRRIEPVLRRAGVEVTHRREGKERTRVVSIRKRKTQTDKRPSATSATSAH